MPFLKMEQNEANLLISVLLMALVTFLPRVIPLQVDIKWPKWVRVMIEYLPVAIGSHYYSCSDCQRGFFYWFVC